MIPAGGAGTRLWPRSRRRRPKHTLSLSGSGKPLLQETQERIQPLAQEVYVLTEAAQIPVIREILPALDEDRLIVEPSARGTTNALGLAALTLLDRDPEAVMFSLASDHVIRGVAAYRRAVREAVAVAETTGCLVTVGLKPRFPATGFGYIRAGAEVRVGRRRAFRVAEFVEKPDLERARAYVESGEYHWNLNTFCWRASSFIEELERWAPDHARGLRRAVRARRQGREQEAARIYNRLPVAAVDYSVMERTDRLLLVPASFEWADVGSWADLHAMSRHDGRGNVVAGEHVLIDTDSSLFYAPGKLVAAIGVSELVVVDSPDVLLVMPRSRTQDVKKVVEKLGRAGKFEYL